MKLVIDVRARDLDRAVKFYTEVLGLTCRVQAKDWAGIAVGDAEIHLYKDGGVSENVELYVDDIDAEVMRMKEKGVKFISGMGKPSAVSVDENTITEFPFGRLAYFKDSEGNELALVNDFLDI